MKTFEEYVDEWTAIAAQIKKLQNTERQMRAHIVAAAFPQASEGTNKFEMVDGRVLKATVKVTRTVDEAAVQTTREEYSLLNDRSVEFDDLLRTKVELAVTPFRELEGEALKVVSKMITSKNGTPSLEIE